MKYTKIVSVVLILCVYVWLVSFFPHTDISMNCKKLWKPKCEDAHFSRIESHPNICCLQFHMCIKILPQDVTTALAPQVNLIKQ